MRGVSSGDTRGETTAVSTHASTGRPAKPASLCGACAYAVSNGHGYPDRGVKTHAQVTGFDDFIFLQFALL